MWLWFGLSTAFIHAFSVIVQKRVLKSTSTLVTTWSLFVLPLPLLALFALRNGLPQVNQLFWLTVAISALVFSLSKTISMLAIKRGILSQIAPLGVFSVVSTYAVGILLLGEKIKTENLVGLAAIIIGAYILNAQGVGKDILKPFKLLLSNIPSRLYLLGYTVGGAIAVIDKIAIRNTTPSNPAFTLLMEDLILATILTVVLSVRKKGWVAEVKQNLVGLTVAAMTYELAILSLFFGYALGPTALVLGVKKMEILFILGLAYLLFGDKPSKNSWVASIIMILGVVLVRL